MGGIRNMAKTFKSLADQADSQEAICDYMYYREENKYMHRARVLISSCGKNQYNRILNIIPVTIQNQLYSKMKSG